MIEFDQNRPMRAVGQINTTKREVEGLSFVFELWVRLSVGVGFLWRYALGMMKTIAAVFGLFLVVAANGSGAAECGLDHFG